MQRRWEESPEQRGLPVTGGGSAVMNGRRGQCSLRCRVPEIGPFDFQSGPVLRAAAYNLRWWAGVFRSTVQTASLSAAYRASSLGADGITASLKPYYYYYF